MYLTVRYCHEFGFLLKQVIVGFPDSAFLSTLLCVTTGGFLLGFDVWKANVAMEAIVALTLDDVIHCRCHRCHCCSRTYHSGDCEVMWLAGKLCLTSHGYTSKHLAKREKNQVGKLFVKLIYPVSSNSNHHTIMVSSKLNPNIISILESECRYIFSWKYTFSTL